MNKRPTPSMTTFQSILHILNIHFSVIVNFRTFLEASCGP